MEGGQPRLWEQQLRQGTQCSIDPQQACESDVKEACLECMKSCWLDNGECTTSCFSMHPGEADELWKSNFNLEALKWQDSISFIDAPFPWISDHGCLLAWL